MGIVDDLKSRLAAARSERAQVETDWRDYARLTGPEMSQRFDETGSIGPVNSVINQQTATSERSERIYDNTAVYMSDRLCSGMESLVSPQSEKWHGLDFDDPFAGEPSAAEDEWFDSVRDHLFDVRYSGRSGFALANKSAIRSAVKLGTGCFYVEENPRFDDIRQPIFYRYLPMWQVYLITDHRGEDVGFFREYILTAEQAVRKFEGKVSSKVQNDADDPKRADRKYTFIHACFERENGKVGADSLKQSKFESVHYEDETKHINKTSGYYEFPLTVFRWGRDDSGPYGVPAAAPVLGTIKSLNEMAMDQLTASAQSVSPPIALYSHEHRLDLNPSAPNVGLIDEQGRKLYSPMIEAADPNRAQAVLEVLREQVREALYGTLWQVLIESSAQTATEVMVRAQEKGEMIGPFAANIQHGYAQMIARELSILGRRGAFVPQSPLALPESMGDKEIRIKYTSPIDTLRKTGDLQKIQAVREHLMAAAQTHPEVLDKMDSDAELDTVLDVIDAPRKIFRTEEEVKQLRDQRAQQMQQQQQLMAAESMAKTAKDATPAMEAMQNAMGNG